ncbi:hypothetical protein [Vibrio parahaemolyticus]|uniref:hypothetical protein n=1 Tax=Vibrio parahaemolyticus TaxID=670 RepID=UPI003D816AAC
MFAIMVDNIRLHGVRCPGWISSTANSIDVWGLDHPNSEGIEDNSKALSEALRLQVALDVKFGRHKHIVSVVPLPENFNQ